jgi:hypothetical protein
MPLKVANLPQFGEKLYQNCNGNAPLLKVIGTVVGLQQPLLTALVEISFSDKSVMVNCEVVGGGLVLSVVPR